MPIFVIIHWLSHPLSSPEGTVSSSGDRMAARSASMPCPWQCYPHFQIPSGLPCLGCLHHLQPPQMGWNSWGTRLGMACFALSYPLQHLGKGISPSEHTEILKNTKDKQARVCHVHPCRTKALLSHLLNYCSLLHSSSFQTPPSLSFATSPPAYFPRSPLTVSEGSYPVPAQHPATLSAQTLSSKPCSVPQLLLS